MNQSKREVIAIIEPTATGYSAYLPEYPGCYATARSRDLIKSRLREALLAHFDALAEAHVTVPAPSSIELSFQDAS